MRFMMVLGAFFLMPMAGATLQFSAADAEYTINNPNQEAFKAGIYSPNGQFILLGSNDKTAKLFDVKGQLQREFEHDYSVQKVHFSPDGEQILTAASTRVHLWQIKGTHEKTFITKNPITAIAFSPDGKRFLATDNLELNIWTQQEATKFFSPDWEKTSSFLLPATAASFVPRRNNQYLVATFKTAAVYTQTETIAQKTDGFPSASNVIAAVYSPDGKSVLTAEQDWVHLWQNNALVWDFASPQVSSIAFSPRSDQILIGSRAGKAQLLSIRGELLATFEADQPVTAVAFSPTQKQILLTSGWQALQFSTAKIGLTPFQFPTDVPITQAFTTTEVATMARLGAKIRYEGEDSIHPLSSSDLPAKVITARELDLSNLGLDEMLPSWLGKFTNLGYLNLANNQLHLEHLAPIRQLTTLETLNLSDNPIFATDKNGAGELLKPLKDLLIVSLNNTQLNDEFLQTLGLPPSVGDLLLDGNRLTALTLANLPHLEKLSAQENAIKTVDLADVPRLHTLNIAGNKIALLPLSELPPSIQELDASGNDIAQVTFERERDLPLLQRLILTSNKPLKALPNSMAGTFYLQNLIQIRHDSSVKVPEHLARKVERNREQALQKMGQAALQEVPSANGDSSAVEKVPVDASADLPLSPASKSAPQEILPAGDASAVEKVSVAAAADLPLSPAPKSAPQESLPASDNSSAVEKAPVDASADLPSSPALKSAPQESLPAGNDASAVEKVPVAAVADLPIAPKKMGTLPASAPENRSTTGE